METGKISPILKVDLSIAEGHFKPISILPTLSKVFERIVAKHINVYCELEATLNYNLSGFHKGHSICDDLVEH